MLASIVLSLTPETECAMPDHVGSAAHAILLDIVRGRDAELAAELHKDAQVKPFTVSSLLGAPDSRDSKRMLRSGETYRLRFTSLSERLSSLLLGACDDFPPEVILDDVQLRSVSITGDQKADALAGSISYRDLAYPRLMEKAAAPNKITLEFLSPTTFRSNNRNIPLPLPELVFGSMLDRWNAFSPIQLSAELRRFAAECLAISRYRLETNLVNIGGVKHTGFRGWCEYTAIVRDAFWLQQIDLLAAFAFFSGVGCKTSMGLGQTRRVQNGSFVPGGARGHHSCGTPNNAISSESAQGKGEFRGERRMDGI